MAGFTALKASIHLPNSHNQKTEIIKCKILSSTKLSENTRRNVHKINMIDYGWDGQSKHLSWVDCPKLLLKVSPSIRFTTTLNQVGKLSNRNSSKWLFTIKLAQEHKESLYLPAVGLSNLINLLMSVMNVIN